MNSWIFVNDVEIYKLKAKDSEINASPVSLGNIFQFFVFHVFQIFQLIIWKRLDYTVMSMILVDYDSIDVEDILDIQKYLMQKKNIK